MKFIHISDTHLVKNKAGLYASDPANKLQRAIDSVNKYQNTADFVVITGDLADRGELEAYVDLKNILETLTIPYYLLIGNHDNRENYFDVFNTKFNYEDSFAHMNLLQDNKSFLFLDTKYQDWHDGGFCEKRFEWLSEQLETNKEIPTYIFMHHPPFNIFHQQMDEIGFQTKEKFWEIVSKYSNIKHIFFGHVHLHISGIYSNIPYSSIRSTNHQVALHSKDKNLHFNAEEKPTYSIVNIEENQVNCIYHQFMDEEIIYPSFIPVEQNEAN